MAVKPVTNEVLSLKLDNQNKDIDEIKGTLKSVAATLVTVGRIEDRQITLINEMGKADKRHEKIEDRVKVIEDDMPGLREMRRWVVGGVVAGVGMIGIAVVSLVLSPKPTYITVESAGKQVPQLSQVPQLPQSKP